MTELATLLRDLTKMQGTPEQQMERSVALTPFVAALPSSTRALCYGDVRLPEKGFYPAILTYSAVSKQTMAWAASGRKNAIEGHHVSLFSSSIPHVGIARESLLPETTAIVIETEGGDAKQAPSRSDESAAIAQPAGKDA